MTTLSSFIVIKRQFIASDICNEIITYLLPLHITKTYPDLLNSCEDSRFCELAKKPRISVHDGICTAIKYEVEFGRGYKLPRIYYNESFERSNH